MSQLKQDIPKRRADDMREYKTIKQTVDVNVLQSVTCNKCGSHSVENDQSCNQEYQTFQTSFGYGSRYDMESWRFELCEDCLTELVKSFKYVPDGFGEDSFYAKYPQIMFEHWKETGEVDLEAGMTPEEIAEQGGSIYVEEDEVFDEDEIIIERLNQIENDSTSTVRWEDIRREE